MHRALLNLLWTIPKCQSSLMFTASQNRQIRRQIEFDYIGNDVWVRVHLLLEDCRFSLHKWRCDLPWLLLNSKRTTVAFAPACPPGEVLVSCSGALAMCVAEAAAGVSVDCLFIDSPCEIQLWVKLLLVNISNVTLCSYCCFWSLFKIVFLTFNRLDI